MLGLGPPRLRRPAAGSARRPCLRLGLRSRPGPLGLRPAGPRLGPPPPGAGRARALALVVGFRRCPRLRGALGLSAGRLRPSARPRGSPGGPRCGVAGSGRWRPWLAPGSAPSSGGLAVRLWSLAAPWRGRCAPAAGRLRPLPRRAGSPCPGPCRAARLPPWAAAPPPSGGGWGRLSPPFVPPPPPPWGPSPWRPGGGGKLGPGALPPPAPPVKGQAVRRKRRP